METDQENGGEVPAPPTPASRIGQRIRRARLLQNLTQGELASGQFSVSYVSALERGQIRPSLGALERLASRLKVPVSDLLADTQDAEMDVGVPPFPGMGTETEQVREEVAAALRNARIAMYQGRLDDAIDIARSVLDRTRLPRDLAAAHLQLAECYLAQQNSDQARDELMESMTLAERAGDRELLEQARNALGNAYLQQRKPLLALECHRQGYEAAQRGDIRDPLFRLNVVGSLADEYWMLGEDQKAVGLFEEAARLADDVVSPERLGQLYWSLATEYADQRDAARAMRYTLRALHTYEVAGSQRYAASAQTRLGLAYVQSRQLDKGEAHLQAGYDAARTLGDAHALTEAATGLSILYLRRRRLDDAEALAREALDSASSRGDAHERVDALLALGEALNARGAHADADARLAEALRLLEADGSRYRLATAYVRLSAIYEQRGDATQALAYLKRAWHTAGQDQIQE
jgi:HTH-type transcriptional regulator, quorum sensing regulator NprR